MENPLVSILIPCYNAGPWIERTIQSAIAQSYQPIEIIVHDDGSNDDSANKLAGFGDQIQFSHAENQGGNKSRNLLLSKAQGSYIKFLDADDELLPHAIESQIKLLKDNPSASAAYSSMIQLSPLTKSEHEGQCFSDIHIDDYAKWISWGLAQTSSTLWLKAVLDQIGGWNSDQQVCQDNELCLRALKQGHSFVYDAHPTCKYYIHGETSTSRKSLEKLLEQKTLLLKDMHDWLLTQNKLNTQHKTLLGYKFWELSREMMKLGSDKAVQFHGVHKAVFNIKPDPDYSSSIYRTLYKLIGFKYSEKIAELLRK